MRGTTIIRAYGQEHTIMAKQHKLFDDSTRAFIAGHSCWCWYNIRMHATSKIITFTALWLIAKYRLVGDPITLVLLYNYTIYMGFIMHFLNCVNWFGRLVAKVERVFNLQEIPQESEKQSIKQPEGWPAKGSVEFKDVFMRYRPNTEQVLRGLTFRAEQGWKIGIVGRTGAGKSTLCTALTRIVELESGSIEIDGVDVGKILLSDLRAQITMIP